MAPIQIIQWIYLFISIFCLLPSFLLIIHFIRTHVLDYIIFAGVFVGVVINQFFSFFYIIDPINILVNQIVTSSYIVVYLFVFIHAVRVKYDRPPRLLLYIGLIWYTILQIMILFYKVVNLPETINFLFITMYNVDAFDIGVALLIQENFVIMGQGYDFFISIFRIFTLATAVHAYLTVKMAVDDVRLKTVKILWIFVGIFTMGRPLLYLIDLITPLDFISAIRSFPDLMAVAIITIIVVRYPECVLISKSQLIRASYLYRKIKSGEFGQIKVDIGLSVLCAYINELPPEFFEQEGVPPKGESG